MPKVPCPCCGKKVTNSRAAKLKHRERHCKEAWGDEFKAKGRPKLPKNVRAIRKKMREKTKTMRRLEERRIARERRADANIERFFGQYRRLWGMKLKFAMGQLADYDKFVPEPKKSEKISKKLL